MSRNKACSFVAIVLLVLTASAPATAGQPGPAGRGDPAPIRLRGATFTPTIGEVPVIPAELTIASYPAGQVGYYIVQFRGPVEEGWKQQVAATAAELLDYLPEFAFKVRMTPEQADRVAGLPVVAWVGIFQPAYRLHPQLSRDGRGPFRVKIEKGADVEQVAAAVEQAGAVVLQRAADRLLIASGLAGLQAMARIPDVAWIEPYVPFEKHNEYGGGVIMGSNAANANGYDGSTQIVAVADTGLGGGTAATAHPDIPASRIIAIHDWPGQPTTLASLGMFTCRTKTITPDGARDVDSGHGTHTAASVVSDGGPAGEGKGVAPAGRLVFQATEDYTTVQGSLCSAVQITDGYYLLGLPDDLHPLYQQAYDDGARIHSNSWGAAVAGDYNANSAETDDFIWNHRDTVITFSAGNSGKDANSDGVVDNDSIGSPATAKNVITVGASENDRQGHWECDSTLTYINPSTGQSCHSLGGMNTITTYGEAWATDFPANPLKDDPTAGNREQMAAFSSRGPTDDGRLKPDVVAPGTYVLSAYSDLYQEGYDGTGGVGANPQNSVYQYDGWGFPLNQTYKYMGGTSMANPLVAGGAVVIKDFYQKVYTHTASTALVKATLINSAVDLLDENNDGVDDNDFPIPNVHEGWGRVNLAAATDKSHIFIDHTSGISSSTAITYEVTSDGARPLKISLVWSDYPSTEAAGKNLVNDLDLIVTAPTGAVTYLGNVFGAGWSLPGGSADRTNNVENVYVQAPVAGLWKVQVKGYNVPNGPQPFALVVDNATWPAPALAITAVGSDARLTWTTRGQDNIYQLWRSASPYFAPADPAATRLAEIPGTSYLDGILGGPADSYFYVVRAVINPGQTSAASNRVGVFEFELVPGG